MVEFITPNKFLSIIKHKYNKGDISDEDFQYLYNLYEEQYVTNYDDYKKGDLEAKKTIDMVTEELELIVGPLSNGISK